MTHGMGGLDDAYQEFGRGGAQLGQLARELDQQYLVVSTGRRRGFERIPHGHRVRIAFMPIGVVDVTS